MQINEVELARRLSKHVHFAVDHWDLSMWDKSMVRSTTKQNQITELEKILEENKTNPNKTIQPHKHEKVDNVVLNTGLQLGIDLLINASSNRIDYNSLGTSSTAESVSQTNLQAEDSGGSYTRLQFSTVGVRSRTNQTLTMKALWADTNLSSSTLTVKESGVHWGSSGTSNCYSRAVFTDFTFQIGFLLLVSISEVHQNGTL